MAPQNKKSHAQKAENAAKKKSSDSCSKSGKNVSNSKNTNNTKPNKGAKLSSRLEESWIPLNVLVGVISLALFVIFLVTAVKPTGFLLRIIRSFMTGIIGEVAFYFAIPAFLYIFVIHIFRAKAPVRMMSVCAVCFVLLCGCISHLVIRPGGDTKISYILDLYQGGYQGKTAGVLCGMIADLVSWAVTDILAFIIFIIAAVFTLLAAVQITPPALLKAIQNRPRPEKEDDEDEIKLEPAQVFVNRIANKQIENKRKKKERQASRASSAVQDTSGDAAHSSAKSRDIMSQIDDIETPVAAASEYAGEKLPAAEQLPASKSFSETEGIPSSMPPLRTVSRNNDVQAGPEQTAPQIQESHREEQAKAAPTVTKVTSREAAVSAAEVASEIAQASAGEHVEYCYPPIELLKRPERNAIDGTLEMRENSRRLNDTLNSFKIDAHIVNVTRGPSVTRYEVELEKGVRLSKLTGCADDIALSLGASGVRIAAVPGKISVVGIEVPNRTVNTVTLREVIDSPEFVRAKSKSSFAVGKDIGGTCIVGNIAKMPHMLIAGTTGSGKSVCMNSIIVSLLYKSSPEDVKLIMVDPKMVELGIYNGIPHLLIPVVTDPKKAAGSLQWAVTEMMRRYKTMSDAGVHDLDSYNEMILENEDFVGEKIPRTVIIIDELADLMMVAAKEVEDSICRIAAMGRAAGIHLIIATQRPSADVITGLMKANIPSRISFAVASAMESRIILDNQGAEKLVGKGDMLYAPIGNGKPLRVQGCFVTDAEVRAVAGYVKENYAAEYNQQVLEDIEKKAQQTGKKAASVDFEPNADELDGDEMLPQAVDVILETGQASVSMLQRRLKLGYARAARIVDEMEEKGYVGPFQGSKPRTILITKEQWAAQRNGQPQQMDFSELDMESSEQY